MNQTPLIRLSRIGIIVDARLICLFIIAIGIGLAVLRAETPPEPQPITITVRENYHERLDPASGLESPVTLANAVIWHPAGLDVLVYHPLDGRPDITYTWIQGVPRQWELVPTDDNYHLVWLNQDGKLWRSQINSNGEQILAALAIDTGTVHDYVAVPLPHGQALIGWQSEENAVKLLRLTERGRPLGEVQTLLGDSDRFSMGVDVERNLHLVWLLGYQLQYATVSFAPTTLDASVHPVSSWPIELDEGHWIDSLRLVASQNELRILWGIIDIANPEHTSFGGFILPEGDTFDWPGEPPMRWLGRTLGDTDNLTATVHLDNRWRPALVDLDGNYQLLSDLSADAGAPQVWIDPSGFYTAAWGRIAEDGTITHQVYSTDPALIQTTFFEEEPEQITVLVAILEGILSIPYGVMWLWLPMVVLMGLKHADQSLHMVMALGLYWAIKLLFPNPALFSDAAPGLVGVLLVAITAVSYGIARQIKGPWQAVLITFLMSDMVLTCIIFGVDLR